MKRLRPEDFEYSGGPRERRPARADDPWRLCFVSGHDDDDRAHPRFSLVSEEEAAPLELLLGCGDGNWYVGAPSYADAPCGVALDKINRAAEILGILEDDPPLKEDT